MGVLFEILREAVRSSKGETLVFKKQIPQEDVRNMEETLDNPEVAAAIERALERGVTLDIWVHANGSPTIYSLASKIPRLETKGKINLFYSPNPLSPCMVNSENEVIMTVYGVSGHRSGTAYFPENTLEARGIRKEMYLNFPERVKRRLGLEYYFVEPKKAQRLGEMIRAKKTPQEITSYLGLESRVTSKEEMYAKTQHR